MPAATRAKISVALLGRRDTPEVRANKRAAALRGSDSPVWVGEGASYSAVHYRAQRSLPNECEHADATCKGILEVTLRHGLSDDLIRISPRGHRYYLGEDVDAGYMRFCRSHHRRYDNAQMSDTP